MVMIRPLAVLAAGSICTSYLAKVLVPVVASASQWMVVLVTSSNYVQLFIG